MDAASGIPAFSMMLEGIGFTISATTEISNQEGINQFSNLETLSDDGQGMNQDQHMIAVVRKPSGGQDGHVINAYAQQLFNLTVYYAWICNKTSRDPSLAATTTAGLRALQPQRLLEKASLVFDVGDIPKYNGRDIPKMFEEIKEYLTRLRGFTKNKLLYIICNTLITLLSADDDETNYMGKDADMIARATILKRSIIGDSYEAGLALEATNAQRDSNALIDQRVVCVVIQISFGTQPAWQCIDGQSRSKLDSVVYCICYNKLLWQSMIDNIDSNLLSNIQALTYRGESRNSNFEKYKAMHVALYNKGLGLVAFGFTMIDERIRIDEFTAGITDPALDVVKTNIMARPELVGDFDAVAKWYDDYIKKIPKPRKISELKTRENHGNDGHQGDGGGNRRGGHGGGSQTGQGGGRNNRCKKTSRKEIDDCTHIKSKYVSKKVYKDYSAAEKAKLYELRLARLDKEGPQGNRNKYVRKIKSLQRQLDESWMGNYNPFDDEASLSDISHANFEWDGLDTKDNKNRVCQGGPKKRNNTKKWKNDTPDNEYVGATPYARVATVATIRTIILRESIPTASTRVITSMTSTVRESSYKLDSHDDTCIFGRGTLIVYDFNRPVNVQGYDPSLGLYGYSTVINVQKYIDPHTGMTYHIVNY